MRKSLASLIILLAVSLACGTVPPAVLTVQSVTPTTANMPPTATQKPQEQKNTPQPTATTILATEPLIVFGCWNIREGASLEFPILSVQCGGELLPLELVANGWIRVDGGYVCNRAFGFNDECR